MGLRRTEESEGFIQRVSHLWSRSSKMISLCGQQEQEELQDPNERLDGTRGKLYVSWCLLSKQKGKYLRGLNIKDDN